MDHCGSVHLEIWINPHHKPKQALPTDRPLVQGNADGKKVGYAPSLQDDQVLRHPDINLQPDEEGLQEDLRSEVSIFSCWSKSSL